MKLFLCPLPSFSLLFQLRGGSSQRPWEHKKGQKGKGGIRQTISKNKKNLFKKSGKLQYVNRYFLKIGEIKASAVVKSAGAREKGRDRPLPPPSSIQPTTVLRWNVGKEGRRRRRKEFIREKHCRREGF